MTTAHDYNLSGVAIPVNPHSLLDEICEHFVEHAEVERSEHLAFLKSKIGNATIRVDDGKLLIDLSCPTEQALQMSQTMLAEHLFYFAGEEPLELSWAKSAALKVLPNLHTAVVVGAEDVTPHMRRVKFACSDISPFLGGDMHVRVLVPPSGRQPIWPGLRSDGRVAWPQGDDELLVRVYTIRAVDAEKRELWIDFLQHPLAGVKTPGADFARDARIGQKVALLGPGGGGFPVARSILLAGDESALPAIARIVEEAPAGTKLQAIIEVSDAAEEQPLVSAASLDVRWLHRCDYSDNVRSSLFETTAEAIASMEDGTFVWFAAEKDDVRATRAFLKGRGHDRKNMYVAWYWERGASQA
ncbi:phage tail protein [Rhizobium sp. Root708]|uniref:DUF2218 domain-containing protein n=1 Tax=Rhizobium sp. Root708 TaxID=1736592 RepID=UPI0006F6681B|nr:DUF2218 domain-containing protein [Rhizobium sp. Root708]KRB58385.1 phage tail protein [Rhizobium sp. Root708]